jgi:hypothetical protein
MKREIKITIKKDYNHYALIEQVNNRDNEVNRSIFIDEDQYNQLREHFIGEENSKLLAFCDHLNSYNNWYDVRFDFMLIDFLNKNKTP